MTLAVDCDVEYKSINHSTSVVFLSLHFKELLFLPLLIFCNEKTLISRETISKDARAVFISRALSIKT